MALSVLLVWSRQILMIWIICDDVFDYDVDYYDDADMLGTTP